MKKLLSICAVVLLMTGIAVSAVPINFEIELPTTNEDGTDYTDPGGYTVKCGADVGGPYTLEHTVNDPTMPPATVIVPVGDVLSSDGTYSCVATILDTSGNESVNSNEVTFPLDRVAPDAGVLIITFSP